MFQQRNGDIIRGSVSDNVINPLVFKKVLPEKAEARKVGTVEQSQKPQARLKNVH